MSINFKLRDTVYLGAYECWNNACDYAAVFLVRQNPFQELITAFKYDTADVRSPIASIYCKASYDTRSIYNKDLKTACSDNSNYVLTHGDYDTYYTTVAREAFLRAICTAGAWDNYGIKEAVIESNSNMEYKTASGIGALVGGVSEMKNLDFVYKGRVAYMKGMNTLCEVLCNYALSVYGVAVSNSKVFSYITNELGFNIIVVPVTESTVTVPAEVSSLISEYITTDATYASIIGAIVSSAYTQVSCLATVFRANSSSIIGLGNYNWTAEPVFKLGNMQYNTYMSFIDRTSGTIPESIITTAEPYVTITLQTMSEFEDIVEEYNTSDKVSVFTLNVRNDFSFFYYDGVYCHDGAPNGFASNVYDIHSIFYTLKIKNAYTNVIGCFNLMNTTPFVLDSARYYWTTDGETDVDEAVASHITNRVKTDATNVIGDARITAEGVYFGASMYIWQPRGYDMGKLWGRDAKYNNIAYYIFTYAPSGSRVLTYWDNLGEIFTIGIIAVDSDTMTIMSTDTTVHDNEEFGEMLHLGIKMRTNYGPAIHITPELRSAITQDSSKKIAIEEGSLLTKADSPGSFTAGLVYADLVISANKTDVRQLDVYSKSQYPITYIIDTYNNVMFIEPNDLQVTAKNTSSSDTAKYECYITTRKNIITSYNSKVYIESFINAQGEVDVKSAASGTGDTNDNAYAYTNLVGTPYTELYINSLLTSILMYTGYIDHIFYATKLPDLIENTIVTKNISTGNWEIKLAGGSGTPIIIYIDRYISTIDSKTGYKVTLINAPLDISIGDGYIVHVPGLFTNGKNYFMYTLDSSNGDNSDFALELSVDLVYSCSCKIPVLYVNNINTSIIDITDNIATFNIGAVPVILNLNTGVLSYSDDVFELDCNINEVSGVFEYMKYCTVSSVFYGVYKAASADTVQQTVTSKGILLGDLDFTVEDVNE